MLDAMKVQVIAKSDSKVVLTMIVTDHLKQNDLDWYIFIVTHRLALSRAHIHSEEDKLSCNKQHVLIVCTRFQHPEAYHVTSARVKIRHFLNGNACIYRKFHFKHIWGVMVCNQGAGVCITGCLHMLSFLAASLAHQSVVVEA